MKKKKLSTIIPVVSLVILTIVTAFAYFTKVINTRDNSIKVGYDSVEIVEDFTPPEKQTEVTEYKKEVSVKNNGTVPCFARVYVDFSDSEVRDISYFAEDQTSTYYKAGKDESDDEAYIKHLPEDWVFIPDSDTTSLAGYFYYKKPLEPNESSTMLFSRVKTDYTKSNIGIRQYDIIVYAESLQTVTKDSIDRSQEADGWRTVWTEFLSE